MPFERPDADDDIGGWTDQAGGTSSLFTTIDESVASDADYITTLVDVDGTSTAARFRLSDPGVTPIEPVTVRFRAKAGNADATLQTSIYEGTGPGTLIAQWTDTLTAGGFDDFEHAFTTPEFSSVSDFDNLYIDFEVINPTEAETTAWVAAVVSNGGTVSAGRQMEVNTLIAGLKTDGVWTKLDRLWLLAAENEPSALTDLVADSLATATNSPTFTTDAGYAGDGTNSFIHTNYNPVTDGVNYIQDSAHISAWDTVAAFPSGGFALMGATDNVSKTTAIFPSFAATTTGDLNSIDQFFQVPRVADGTPHLMLTRGSSSQVSLYANGAVTSGSPFTLTSHGAPNLPFYICGIRFAGNTLPSFGTTDQIAATSIGGDLSATDASNLYSRLRTYMTAVGVP